jgi:hypothetical protein
MPEQSPHWESAFLNALERCGVASEAARLAGTGVRNAYKRRKGNPTFAAAWDAAVALHRSEAGRRAMSAVAAEGVAYNSGPDGAKLVRAGQSRWSARGEEAFLTELTVNANVKRAAKAAGFSTAAVYKRRLKDKRFAAAWEAAIETGKARVQAYLVEAATRTFDPDELPIGDEREIPKVSIGEAINIAKLGSSNGSGRAGKGRHHADPYFDGWEEEHEQYQAAVDSIVAWLERLRERMEARPKCPECGQAMPLTSSEFSA